MSVIDLLSLVLVTTTVLVPAELLEFDVLLVLLGAYALFELALAVFEGFAFDVV